MKCGLIRVLYILKNFFLFRRTISNHPVNNSFCLFWKRQNMIFILKFISKANTYTEFFSLFTTFLNQIQQKGFWIQYAVRYIFLCEILISEHLTDMKIYLDASVLFLSIMVKQEVFTSSDICFISDFMSEGKLFMNIKNNKIPRTCSWRTPAKKFYVSEFLLPIFTFIFLSGKNILEYFLLFFLWDTAKIHIYKFLILTFHQIFIDQYFLNYLIILIYHWRDNVD